MTAARTASWRPYAVALVAAFATLSLGGAVTDIGDWYRGLDQPPWKPPDLAFGPVWATMFTLIAIAGATAWRHSDTPSQQRQLLAAFALNGLLNVSWSYLFFSRQRPDWALPELVVLWLSIVVMMVVAGRSSRLAAWLLVPYLGWVSFAGVLNYAVIQRNAPF